MKCHSHTIFRSAAHFSTLFRIFVFTVQLPFDIADVRVVSRVRIVKNELRGIINEQWRSHGCTSARVGREICTNSKSFWRSRGGW